MIISPRWRKLRGDIEAAQGRLLMMVIAIASGVFAVACLSTAYTILQREIVRNYGSTHPAAALIDVDVVDGRLLAGVRDQPRVTAAEAGGRLTGRIEVRPDQWLPLLLFVVPDFRSARISTVRLETGGWPDADDGIVIERSAVALAHTAVDRMINVETAQGARRALTVTGVVHDPSLAPAWQEQTVYGYVTPATLRFLGQDATLHLLKVAIQDAASDPAGVDQAVLGIAAWMGRAGYSVGSIRIPPYRHPHQGMMTRVVRMLLVFGVLTLILGAILTATLTSSLLAPQVRQIAVMKAIGAATSQIMRIYLALIAAIGAVAVAIGLPLGIVAGRALAESSARMLNLELATRSVPVGLYAVQVLFGVGLPLLAALLPIRIAAARTVRETLNDFGVRLSAGPGRWLLGLSRGFNRDPALRLAIRSTVRRKARLVLTLGLLATAGAMFITSQNLRSAWQANRDQAQAERHFDAEFRFAHAQPETAVLATVAAVPGVVRVEPWSDDAATLARSDGLRIVRTYPDGGHGSLGLQVVPRDSRFLRPVVVAGHWLDAADAGGAVVNGQALAMLPGVQIGDPIALVVDGVPTRLRLTGVVREHLSQATVYTTPEQCAQATGRRCPMTGIRVALSSVDARPVDEAMVRIARALENSGVTLSQSVSQAQVGRVLGGHLFILIVTLEALSMLMGLVGAMGLGSAMSISVLERTREFAVMRVIGAGAWTLRRMVVGEAILVGAMSAGLALVASVPLTRFVGGIVGTASLGPAFTIGLSAAALPAWLAITAVGAITASAGPAWKAARLTVREALAFQ